MGIEVASSFTRKAAVPLDDAFAVNDLTARDAIISGVRFEGMLCYVKSDQTMYQLKGGITNSHWAEAGGSAGANLIRNKFSGNGSTTAFTLSIDPLAKENTSVFIHGVYQGKDTYSISGTTLTFTQAPPTATDNVEVMIIVPMSSFAIPDGSVTSAKLSAPNKVISTLQSGAITLPTSQQDITNLSVTITTSGRPVWLTLIPNKNPSTRSYIRMKNTSATAFLSLILMFNYTGTSSGTAASFLKQYAGSSVARTMDFSPSEFSTCIDIPAGTYTFVLNTQLDNGDVLEIWETRLMAMEL